MLISVYSCCYQIKNTSSLQSSVAVGLSTVINERVFSKDLSFVCNQIVVQILDFIALVISERHIFFLLVKAPHLVFRLIDSVNDYRLSCCIF